MKKEDLLHKIRQVQVTSKRGTRQAISTVKQFPAHNKLGLSMGAASLGLGLVNYKDNQERKRREQNKLDLEQKSLNALQKIHKAIVTGKE